MSLFMIDYGGGRRCICSIWVVVVAVLLNFDVCAQLCQCWSYRETELTIVITTVRAIEWYQVSRVFYQQSQNPDVLCRAWSIAKNDRVRRLRLGGLNVRFDVEETVAQKRGYWWRIAMKLYTLAYHGYSMLQFQFQAFLRSIDGVGGGTICVVRPTIETKAARHTTIRTVFVLTDCALATPS